MEWTTELKTILGSGKRYLILGAAVLAGLLLMCIPEEKEVIQTETVVQEETDPKLQDALAAILSKISGAGDVEVLLTEASGQQTIYQTDENRTENTVRRDSVLITNAQREETGLIRQVNPPTYQGAIILCQGADSASVKLAVTEAVKSVTGLTSDRITVLKMK